MASSKLFLGILLTLLSPSFLSPVYAGPAPQPSSSVPTAIVTAPAPSSTSSPLKIPTCAQHCLSTATLAQPCVDTDTQCLCAHSELIKTSAVSCLTLSTCSQSDINIAGEYYDNLCISLGYPLTSTRSTSNTLLASGSPTPPTYATPSSSSDSSESSSNASLKTSIIIAIAAGGAVILAITFITCFVIFRRRRRSTEPQIPPPAPRKESQGSQTPTIVVPVRSRTNLISSKLFAESRKSSVSTVFTMISLTPSEKSGTSHLDRQSKVYSVSDYSPSHYSREPSALMMPINLKVPTRTEKELPAEPVLSPGLAHFDFDLADERHDDVGVVNEPGMRVFHGREPEDIGFPWEDGAAQHNRGFL